MSKLLDTQNSSPYDYYYNPTDKLFLHIMKRAEEAFDKADRKRDKIKTKEDFIKYQENARKTFLKCLGKIPYDNNYPLNAKVTGVSVYEGLKIENVVFELRKNVFATANLYIPENATGKLPGILMQCGHSDLGHLFFNYRRVCTTIAKAGNVVLAMSPLGQGERKHYLDIFAENESPTKEHQYCGNQCFLADENLAKYFLADAMRAIDYLQSRPEVDADKIGATGSSGGGTMTAVLSAVDQRVKACAPGTFITTRREYFFAGSPQDAEQVWPNATLNLFDHYELLSCICPRACLILGVTSDFFCREGTEKVYAKVKEFYELMGIPNNLQLFWDDSRHSYTPNLAKAAADFFNEMLKGEKTDAEIVEPSKEFEQLKATKKGSVLADFNSTLVFEENKKIFLKKKAKMTPERIKKELTKKVYSFRQECAFNIRRVWEQELDDMYIQRVMWFTQKMLPCYGVLFTPLAKKNDKLPVTVCLWDGGTDKIVEKEAFIEENLKADKAVFIADLSGMGKCAPAPLLKHQNSAPFFTPVGKLNMELAFLGDSICAMRAYDLIRCLDMLKENYGLEDATVYAEGNYSVYPEIAKKVGCEFKTTYENPIKIYDVLTNKIYDDYHFADIMMPGLGLYID